MIELLTNGKDFENIPFQPRFVASGKKRLWDFAAERSGMSRVVAVRGATTVEHDSKEEVIEATKELLLDIMESNKISPDDIVFMLFTATPDIRSEFPARAAREMGLMSVPLICASELDIVGSLQRCIRVLVLFYSRTGRKGVKNSYLRKAKSLRPDLWS